MTSDNLKVQAREKHGERTNVDTRNRLQRVTVGHPDFEQLVAKRTHLKQMLAAAKALPDTTRGKAGAIERLEVEILLIKLHVNCVY